MLDRAEIAIREMGDRHLVNTIRLLQRKAQSGITVRRGGGTTAEDMWYDEDIVTGKRALEILHFADFIAEANKRGLKF